MSFRWIDWNRDHIAEHGVDPQEAEQVIRQARPPFPQQLGDDKFLVMVEGLEEGSSKQSMYLILTIPFSLFMPVR